VALPIEADSPEEAVKEYWRYVNQLGSDELPTFVSPVDDELAMTAWLTDGPTNLDPEEED
jgi:hypothetical protein